MNMAKRYKGYSKKKYPYSTSIMEKAEKELKKYERKKKFYKTLDNIFVNRKKQKPDTVEAWLKRNSKAYRKLKRRQK